MPTALSMPELNGPGVHRNAPTQQVPQHRREVEPWPEVHSHPWRGADSVLRLLREAHSYGAESRIDVQYLARDSSGEIGAEERGRIAHILERHVAAKRCDLLNLPEHPAKP